jgi:hypothetical protein
MIGLDADVLARYCVDEARTRKHGRNASLGLAPVVLVPKWVGGFSRQGLRPAHLTPTPSLCPNRGCLSGRPGRKSG